VTTKDLYQYFFRLHQKNESMIKETKWKKKIRIGILGENGGIIKSWGCIIGYQPAASKLSSSLSNVAVFDMNDYSENGDNQEFVEEYSFDLAEKMLRDIVDEKLSWENALASMRVQLSRSPDIYDTAFMVTLRFGTFTPEVCENYVHQKKMGKENVEMIELPGLSPGTKIQRYCPHQGADLKHASVVNGVIICHRHGWKFCAESGKCLTSSGKDSHLKMSKLEW
jgi:hypothetical protein